MANPQDTTRRNVIEGLGVYPAVTIALAGGTAVSGAVTANLAAHIQNDDPTFAAIEAHKAAIAAYNAHVSQEDALEAMLPEDKRKTFYWDDIKETDDPRWISYHREYKRLYEIEGDVGDIGPNGHGSGNGIRSVLATPAG